MARYRKIDSRIWNDGKVRSLSLDATLVFLFVLTHPSMTMVGAMRATIPGLAVELMMQVKAFRLAFGQLTDTGLLKYRESEATCWAPNFLRYNSPESPNVIRSWAGAMDLIPEGALKAAITKSLETHAEGLPEGFRKAFRETFGKPSGNPSGSLPKALPQVSANPDPEQEQSTGTGAGPETSRARPTPTNGTAKSAAPLAAVAWREKWDARWPNEILRASQIEWGQLHEDAKTLGLDELGARMDRYLASESDWLIEHKHPLRAFVKDIAEYGQEPAEDLSFLDDWKVPS